MIRDIAVVGTGVGGLAVATLLARAGHRVAVLERLGLRGEITALGARITRLHGTTDRGGTVFGRGYEDLAPGLDAWMQ